MCLNQHWKIWGGGVNKFIVLFVSFGWGVYKGIDVIQTLSERLDDRYQIVVVGTDESAEAMLSGKITRIRRTQNQQELAAIYTAADVFANPTREEVLGMVNIEALACGTPVVTFKTGGSPECIDKSCGIVVPKDDVTAMENAIKDICEHKPYLRDDCIRRAAKFGQEEKFKEYVELYRKLEKR